jgi:hypothetical protein
MRASGWDSIIALEVGQEIYTGWLQLQISKRFSIKIESMFDTKFFGGNWAADLTDLANLIREELCQVSTKNLSTLHPTIDSYPPKERPLIAAYTHFAECDKR